MKQWIHNTGELAITPARRDALAIAEAAYNAIDTESVIRSHLSLEGTNLSVGGKTYNLAAYDRIRVFGIGKASCKATGAIDALLEGHITDGLAIDVRAGSCGVIDTIQGTHPRPTPANAVASGRIVEMAKESTERDLVIVVVSGGGSALLCYPEEECEQAARLYDDLLRVGATIEEMNTVRKHISGVKGGALAAFFAPADIIGLIFCDIAGDHFEDIASGPTYLDRTTVADAQAILDKYQLTGYALTETPKDPALFSHVHNVPMVSNGAAVEAMMKEAERLGYRAVSVGRDLFDAPRALVERMMKEKGEKTAVIAAGEPSLTVTKKGGKGGRCQYVALEALKLLGQEDTLLAFASDGTDNSDSAGAIADTRVVEKARERGVSIDEHLANFDTYGFFEVTGDLPFTGVTDANVSDLFVLLSS